jgi:transcription-repair coupling factor (superfamily II helicase)
LGSEQSGFIDSIGIDLYMKILQEEIARRQGAVPEAEKPLKIKLPFPSISQRSTLVTILSKWRCMKRLMLFVPWKIFVL